MIFAAAAPSQQVYILLLHLVFVRCWDAFFQVNCLLFSSLFPTFLRPICRSLIDDSEEAIHKPKRGMDMDTNGFYGDTFNGGFGNFETAKRAYHPGPGFFIDEDAVAPLVLKNRYFFHQQHRF